MPYAVKWKLNVGSEVLQSSGFYALPSGAVDFACTVFSQHPFEIGIEGPSGMRIERDTIFRLCQERGPPRRPVVLIRD